jgi:L-cysteine S-thiosulfotransferase
MRHEMAWIAALGLAAAALGCGPARKSAAGFRLPDGDVEAGRVAFTQLGCASCHTVAGVDLPAPVADPPVPVVLGGLVTRERTDGELVTAIVDPSHKIAAGYAKQAVMAGERSRMGDFSEAMTVRQLADLVSFLHSRYTVVRPRTIK